MSPISVKKPVELESILRELQLSDKPLKASELGKRLGQKNGTAVKALLDVEVSAGRVYAWSKTLYWTRSPKELARERLLQVAASEILTKGALDKQAADGSPKISSRIVKEVRALLAGEGVLREVAPPSGAKSKTKVVVNVQSPGVYLEPLIAKLLADFGMERSKEQIHALLAAATPQANVRPEGDIRQAAEKMFGAMNRIALAPGTTVTFYRLHQQPELAHVPKLVFDGAALLLQQERRALLSVHDHAARLPQAEQDELVTDGLGNYYVSIYAI